MEDILNVNQTNTIHAGVDYNRREHVEREEELYVNPSNLWRIAECPASARKICRMASSVGKMGRFGLTVDHIVASAILKGTSPREVGAGASESIIKQAEVYYGFLMAIMRKHPGSVLRVEHMMQGDWIPNFCGIADAVLYIPQRKELFIIDHKTGTNARYKPADFQLQAYACMAYDELTAEGYDIQKVALLIYQPELIEQPTRGRVFTEPDTIDRWHEKIAGIVAYARDHLAEANPDCYRCLLCPHARSCPALRQYDTDNGGKFRLYRERMQRRFN